MVRVLTYIHLKYLTPSFFFLFLSLEFAFYHTFSENDIKLQSLIYVVKKIVLRLKYMRIR